MKDQIRETVVSTLWGKNYSELMKAERPAVDNLVEAISSLINKGRIEAEKKTEKWARMNEHHVVSKILTNSELGNLSPETRKRLKARFAELKTLEEEE